MLRDGLNILHAKMRALPMANGADLKSVDGFKGDQAEPSNQYAEAFRTVAGHPPAEYRAQVLFAKECAALAFNPKPGVAIMLQRNSQTEITGWARVGATVVIDERAGGAKI